MDCFKPTEVSSSPRTPPLTPATTVLPDCDLLCFLPSRTSSQSCWTRSEGCRSSPRLRRNDGHCPPHHHPSPTSALTSRLPTAPSFIPAVPFSVAWIKPDDFVLLVSFFVLFFQSNLLLLNQSTKKKFVHKWKKLATFKGLNPGDLRLSLSCSSSTHSSPFHPASLPSTTLSSV